MKKIRYIFLWIILRFDLWKIDRQIRRGVHFDLDDFTEKNELIQATKKFWGKKYGRDISDQEAVSIITNFRNFMKTLASISQEKDHE